MANKFHREISFADGHIAHSIEYANAAARIGDTTLLVADIGRIARQLDDDTFYILIDATPTWTQISSVPDLDVKVAVDALATADFIGALATDGVLRSTAPLTYADGGDFITLGIDEMAIDHDNLLNTHNLTTDIDHNTITNNHNLTTDIDHDSLLNFVAGEHFLQSAISIPSSQITDFDEAAQDAIGSILLDTSSIDFTYDDTTPNISAVVLPTGVDHDALLNFVANEHIDWTGAGAGTIHTDNYIEGGDGTDTTAIHDNVASEISVITEKVTPASGDFLIIEDSAAANVKKRVLVGNLPTAGGGEANTASNSGAGVGTLALAKVGIDLPFKTILAGTGINVVNNADTVEIESTAVAIFGSEFDEASSDGESSTTSDTFIQKLRLTTASLPAGDYRIGYTYMGQCDNEQQFIAFQVQINDTTTISSQDPVRIGQKSNDGWELYGGFAHVTLTAGVKDIDIDFRNDSGSTTLIKEARLEIWRTA